MRLACWLRCLTATNFSQPVNSERRAHFSESSRRCDTVASTRDACATRATAAPRFLISPRASEDATLADHPAPMILEHPLSDEERAFLERVAEFSRDEVMPHADDW